MREVCLQREDAVIERGYVMADMAPELSSKNQNTWAIEKSEFSVSGKTYTFKVS